MVIQLPPKPTVQEIKDRRMTNWCSLPEARSFLLNAWKVEAKDILLNTLKETNDPEVVKECLIHVLEEFV